MADISRRWFVSAIPAIIAAPAIVRAASLMPVKSWFNPYTMMACERFDIMRANGSIRTMFALREEALPGLRDWWATRIDTSFFNQVTADG